MTPLKNIKSVCFNMPCLHNRYDTCTLKSNDGIRMFHPQMDYRDGSRENSCIKCDYYKYVGGFYGEIDMNKFLEDKKGD